MTTAVPPRTTPLPPVRLRRWPRPVGFVFFVWTLLMGCVASVIAALLALITMVPFPPMARIVPRNWARTVLALCGVRARCELETPLPEGPVVFVSNHQSLFDILALFAALSPHRDFVFVAKKSIFSYPFLGWFISAAGYIPVDRSNREAAIRSLEKAGERIREGKSVMVFAEGTRSPDGRVWPFKKGAFHVALQAGVPIVPVAIEGALQVCPKRRWYVCPNTIRIVTGPSIDVAGVAESQRDDLIRQVRSEVIRLHRRLGGAGGDESAAIAGSGLPPTAARAGTTGEGA